VTLIAIRFSAGRSAASTPLQKVKPMKLLESEQTKTFNYLLISREAIRISLQMK